jgi:hypothetical protein
MKRRFETHVDLTGDEPVSTVVQPPASASALKQQHKKSRKTMTSSMRLAYWKTGKLPENVTEDVTEDEQHTLDFLSGGKSKVPLKPGMVLAVVRTGAPRHMDACTCEWVKKHFMLPTDGCIRFFQARKYCDVENKLLWGLIDLTDTFDDYRNLSLPSFDLFENAADAQFWAQAGTVYCYLLQHDDTKSVHDWVPNPQYHLQGAHSRFHYHVSCIQTCKGPAPSGTVWLSTIMPVCTEFEQAQQTNKMMKDQLEYANAVAASDAASNTVAKVIGMTDDDDKRVRFRI